MTDAARIGEVRGGAGGAGHNRMSVLVIYDSLYGDTAEVARAVGGELERLRPGAVRMLRAADEVDAVPRDVELLIVGGPTQRHRITATLRRALVALAGGGRGLDRVRAAAFDTRYRMSSILSGSAAADAAKLLRGAGCELVGRPESFFMARGRPDDGKSRLDLEQLEPDELDRARAWARGLLEA